eukprot:scaffold115235_cov51-Phaeocystis_antarctica.AAC.1
MVLVWSCLAHTLLASHVFNGSMRGCLTLRRDECRRYLVFGFSLAHTLLASHAFNGSRRRLPHAQAR